MRHFSIAALVLALAAFAPAPATAEEDAGVDFMAPFDPGLADKIRRANGECYECHSGQGLKSPPRADLDMTKLAGMAIPPAGYDASLHAGMDCRDCHTSGFAGFPHAKPAESRTKPCAECHNRDVPTIEQELKRSAHGEKISPSFNCQSCHDPHSYQLARNAGPRKVVAQDNKPCIDCHDSVAEMARFEPMVQHRTIDEAHAWLPNARFHWAAVRCVDCHTPVTPEKGHALSHDISKKDKAPRDCVICHSVSTTLSQRLYRHLAVQPQSETAGFVNAYILPDAYVIGATRNAWLDRASFVILALAVAALAAHALGRILASPRRRNHRDG